MNVMLVNGSPNEKGCTRTALNEVAATLVSEGIGVELFWIGRGPIAGCADCGVCRRTGRCAAGNDVNDFLARAGSFDGFVFGSPVYFASANGTLTAFLDRLFFTDRCGRHNNFYLKPAAAVVSARRAGTTAALDQLNKYFQLMEMPVISSRYWNMVHGSEPDEVRRDLEGLQTMRTLAKNLAWFLRCRKAGEKAGVPLPAQEPVVMTNFIR